jgi:transposase
MALGRQTERQSELLLSWSELPRSQGHPFYDRLQEILRGAGFDHHVETLCQPHYSSVAQGRKSLPPGRYFRMLLVGYFEGIDSERGIECGQPEPTRVPAVGKPGARAGPFLAVADPLASAAGSS